jgi:hypothetical protein
MNIRTFKLVAGLALGTLTGLASAAALDVSSGSAGFVGTPPAGAFSDVYTFSVLTPTTLTGIVTSVVNGGQDVDFLSLTLTGPTGPLTFSQVNADPFEIWTISTGELNAGSYTLTLVGSNSAAAGTYSGNIALAPVPEPETYALMLAGIAAVGFVVMRRRG